MGFYRYIIYKLYSWALKKEKDTPILNVIVTLTAVHYFQLLTLYCIALKFFNVFNIFSANYSIAIGIFSIAFLFLNYFLLYNKKQWESYLQEFKDESEKESRKGKIIVLSYLIGSILLFFIISIMIFT